MKRKSCPVPAFASDVQMGMTLRDYFAATALKSLILIHHYDTPETLSRNSYYLADAMMHQRDTPKPKKSL